MLKKAIESFREVLYPDKCVVCGELFRKSGIRSHEAGEDIKDVFEGHLSFCLCKICMRDFIPITRPLCLRCGRMFSEAPGEDHLCGDCLTKPGRARRVRSVGIYDTTLSGLIKAYKFKKKLQLFRPLGSLLFAGFIDMYSGEDLPDLILPVPLHKKRLRQRKFNQAWLLVRDWKKNAEAAGFSVFPEVVHDIIIRQKMTIPQTGLDRKARKTNTKGAFSVPEPDKVSGKRILLADDVYTSGATVDECARILLKSGAAFVDVLTLARTQDLFHD